jgi:hypothetical protein
VAKGRPIGKLHQDDVRRFYVYHIMDGQDVVYVGKGSGRRSQVQARKFGLPCVIVERFHSESKAYAKEVEMISSIRPKLNKHVGGNGSKAIKSRKTKDKWQRTFERIGAQRYSAMLVIAYGKKLLPQSKLDEVRRVAYG